MKITILRIRLRAKKPKLFYQIKVNNYRQRYNISWVISGDLMKIMKLSHVGKKYESDVYEGIWAIGCCPNGPDMDDSGIVFIYLNLCALPININKIKCKWKVYIPETGTIDYNQV